MLDSCLIVRSLFLLVWFSLVFKLLAVLWFDLFALVLQFTTIPIPLQAYSIILMPIFSLI